MNEASAASGTAVSQATTAWSFSDPVVLLSAFTIIFATGMGLWLWYWISKRMDEDANNDE